MAGHPTYHANVVKLKRMRGYMDRRVTIPKLVTSPTWGPPPPCKQALIYTYITPFQGTVSIARAHSSLDRLRLT